MRIDRSKFAPIADDKAVSRKAPQAETSQGPEVVVAGSVQRAIETTSSKEAERAARVAELKLQVDTGEYRVDYEALAKRLVEEEMARPGSK